MIVAMMRNAGLCRFEDAHLLCHLMLQLHVVLPYISQRWGVLVVPHIYMLIPTSTFAKLRENNTADASLSHQLSGTCYDSLTRIS